MYLNIEYIIVASFLEIA